MSGFTRDQRRQSEDLMKRLRPEIYAAVRRALSDPRMTDEREPLDDSVARGKIKNNAVGDAALASGSQNADRAVDRNHIKSNAVGGDALASGNENNERAVEGKHVKTGTLSGSHFEDGSIGDGKLAKSYSESGHGHGDTYAGKSHDHDGSYAGTNHSHSGYIKASSVGQDKDGYLMWKR